MKPLRKRQGLKAGRRVSAYRRDPLARFEPSALSQQLSAFEFAFIVLMYGFNRWVETCMEVAQVRGLAALDILVLHAVNHRARGNRISEICTVLNIDDSHLVSYAVKKLLAAGLITVERRGRERHFLTTSKGDEACTAYRKVRERYLVPGVAWMTKPTQEIERDISFLRTLSAVYDQAGRFAIAEAPRESPPPLRTKR